MAITQGIRYLQKVVSYTNTTSFQIGYLPPNSYITDIKVFVTTDFTDGVLDIGTSSSANAFADDVDLNGTGKKTVTATAQWGVIQSTSEQTQVKGIVIATGTGLAAGSAKVVVEYAFNE